MREAMFYDSGKDNVVLCGLCNHHCKIKEGRRGICGVRENRAGRLYSMVYGRLVSENVDPIEKKPLFHFLPGSRSYSISTVGCNFRCLHCQNYQISQYPVQHSGAIVGEERSPEAVVESAEASGCASISYTYVEPTIFYEFAFDCGKLAREKGIKNIFVSNGYMSSDASRHMVQFLDGINIDIKSFRDEFYKKICGARVQPVLDNVKYMKEAGVWVEVTTLLIPGLNDSSEELREIARFIKDVDPDMPWHVSAFYPTYRLTDRPPTPKETLFRARNIGIEEGLSFVYTGNLPGQGGESTYCPSCREEVISRFGYTISKNSLENGCCAKCGKAINGVWG